MTDSVDNTNKGALANEIKVFRVQREALRILSTALIYNDLLSYKVFEGDQHRLSLTSKLLDTVTLNTADDGWNLVLPKPLFAIANCEISSVLLYSDAIILEFDSLWASKDDSRTVQVAFSVRRESSHVIKKSQHNKISVCIEASDNDCEVVQFFDINTRDGNYYITTHPDYHLEIDNETSCNALLNAGIIDNESAEEYLNRTCNKPLLDKEKQRFKELMGAIECISLS